MLHTPLIKFRRLILVGIFSFLFGVFLWSVLPNIFNDKSFAIFCLIFSILIFIYSFVSGRQYWFLVIAIIFFSFGLGITRAILVEERMTVSGLEGFGQFEAIVVSEADERENSQRLIVKIKDLPVKVMINVPFFPELFYGDILKISGDLILPKNFMTDTGREFSYISFLKTKGITYEMYRPEVMVMGYSKQTIFKRTLFTIKGIFVDTINKNVPEPNSTLANGLLVGARRSLGEDIEDLFRRVGIIHIVVLSGYNITIVAGTIMKILSFLPRYLSVTSGIISIILFAITVGAGATVVRASIMAILAIIALALGRTSQISFSLILAGFFMVFFNPFILVYDPGFQLSFLATIGLIYLSPIVSNKLSFITNKFSLREIAGVTIATQIFVAPFLAYLSGTISLASLPTNLLVLPMVPITMLWSFLAGIIGLLSPVLALPFSFFVYISTGYIFVISTFFGAFPLSEINLPPVNILFIIFVYSLLASYLFSKRKDLDIISHIIK